MYDFLAIVRRAGPGRMGVGDGGCVRCTRVSRWLAAREAPVETVGAAGSRGVGFRNEVVPVLTKLGCNQGACHGGQHGKGDSSSRCWGSSPKAITPRSSRVPRNGG